jgi:hypothetical protein
MGQACSINGRNKKCIPNSVGKPEGMRLSVGNLKTSFNWLWRGTKVAVLVNMKMNFQSSIKVENFLSS